jgi:DNA polymerase III subunit delta'
MIDDALSFKPFEADKKIVIVDDAETMNISAANAFLKTLEEPPEDSIIILVSSRPDRLPDTIRSRCSRINFEPLSTESCMQVLKGRIPEENLDLVTRLCMGRPGTALSSDLVEEKAWFVNLFMSMMNAEKDGWTGREDMEKWLELSLTIFRDLAVLKITGITTGLINMDIHEYLVKLSKSADLKVIIKLYNELSSLKSLLFFNLNKSVTWNYTASLLRKELSV